ncbi:MAG TPA: glycosyltransferase family 2 protein [Oculatellaceae cyanobacterium]
MTAFLRSGISVVIPVYNSAGMLKTLVESIKSELVLFCADFEVILVNDGSIDASWNVISSLVQEHKWLRAMNLMRNYGQNNALLCGIRAARFDVTVTMDDDLQHPPAAIKLMVAKLLSEGLDVVYGRPIKEEHGLLRDSASVMTKVVIKHALGVGNAPDVCSFRAFKTKLRKAFDKFHSPFINTDVLLSWGASKLGVVFVEHQARTFNTSNYTFRKLVNHAVNLLTGFSTLPLQFASVYGIFLIGFGILLLAYVVVKFLVYPINVPGFPFLASIIIIFSGAQLMALGIIGEYVGRIYTRTMDRPPYILDETLDNSSNYSNYELQSIVQD